MRWLTAPIGALLRAMVAAAPVRLWAMILGAPPLTALACWFTWIVWKGPWPVERAQQQLDIIGWALWGALALIGVIVISLASVKVKAAAPGGAAFEVDGDADDPPPRTT